MNRRLLLATALLAAALAPAAFLGAEGQARGGTCAASIEESRRHMDRGLDFFDHQRFGEAASEFDAAFAAQPFSAALCNAAMAYAQAKDYKNAILRYQAFLQAEPNPPDLVRIKKTITWLVAQQAALDAASSDGGPGAQGADGGVGDAGVSLPFDFADAGAGNVPPPPELMAALQSQVVIESQPPGAPLRIFAKRAGAQPFKIGDKNPGWDKVTPAVKTPYDISLPEGDYHLVIDAFQDYKASETDLHLALGRVYSFKANLSQGTFLGFLHVTAPVEGAPVYLDDPPPHRRHAWGSTPYGDLLESGEHRIFIEVPGFEPFSQKVSIEHGKVVELAAPLERERFGYLRVDGNAEEVSVKVDGVYYGSYSPIGEPLKIRLASGAHEIELAASGRKTFKGKVDVPRGQEIAVHGRLSYTPPRRDAALSGALAAGAIVGGVYLLGRPSHAFVKDFSSPIGLRSTDADGQPWFKVGGGVALGLAGLLTAATVYTIINDPNPPSRLVLDEAQELEGSPVRKSCVTLKSVAPTVGPGQAGVLLQGSF
ncbi:MAG: PEGA domain-containing protein [Byssovorax sp.]